LLDIDNPSKLAKPCKRKGCNHLAREHNRVKKTNGEWNGRCSVWDCDCPNYIKPN